MRRSKKVNELDKEIADLIEERETLDMRLGRAMSNEDRGNVHLDFAVDTEREEAEMEQRFIEVDTRRNAIEDRGSVRLDFETRSAVELGRDAHAQAEIVIMVDAEGVMRTLRIKQESVNSNMTTVTGRIANSEPEQQRLPDSEIARNIKYAMQRGKELGVTDMDFNEAEMRIIASQLDGRGVAEGIFDGFVGQLGRGMAAASALGLTSPANTFRPRPKRLPGRVVKVAPGLWMRSTKPKKFKGSKAAKKASRQRR